MANNANSPGRQRIGIVLVSVFAVIALACVGVLVGTSVSHDKPGNSTASSTSYSSGSATNSVNAEAQIANNYLIQQNDSLTNLINEVTRGSADDPKALGNVDAPVVMLDFSDASCPMCYRFDSAILPQLQQLIDNGTLRIEYHHRVIFDEQYHSLLGAYAAEAASLQGKFWEFLSATTKFAGSQGDQHVTWDEDVVRQIAQSAGVTDVNKLVNDMNSSQVQDAVKQDDIEGQRLQIGGTPFFIFNHSHFISGAADISVFQAVINTIADDAN